MGKYECVVLELELTDVDTHWRIKKKICTMMTVIAQRTLFWDVKPCSLVKNLKFRKNILTL